MTTLTGYCQSSIGRKQIVATTGLLLILFIISHLAGNLLILLGPEVYNGYAQKLAGLRPGLYLVEIALAGVFIIHIYFTALLVLENIAARSQRYNVYNPKGERSLAARLMPYTGTYLLAFIIWHLIDFTFVDKHGPRSFLPDGKSYELYGIVYNSFADPGHSILYIVAMLALGFHLGHGVASFMQTFGFNHPVYAPRIKRFSYLFASVITFGYCLIPLYVMYEFKILYCQ